MTDCCCYIPWTWSNVEAIPLSLFCMGGYQSTVGTASRVADNDGYTPSTDSWAGYTALPSARFINEGVGLAGKCYSFGGSDGTSTFNLNTEYDPATDTVGAKATITSARSNHSAFKIGDNGYASAGGPGGSTDSNLYQYSQPANTWATKTASTDVTRDAGAFGFSATGHVCGGDLVSGADTLHNEEYNEAGNSWAFRTDFPSPARTSCTGTTVDAIGYLGGSTTTHVGYTPGSDSWATLTAVPSPLRTQQFAGGFTDKLVYAMGFFGSQFNDTDLYTPSTDSWAVGTNATHSVDSGASAVG